MDKCRSGKNVEAELEAVLRTAYALAAEVEQEMGRKTRIMRLEQAVQTARNIPGLYVLLQNGRPVYAGETGNLGQRMRDYARHFRIAGNLSQWSVRLSYMSRTGTPVRQLLEGRLIRRVNRTLRTQKRAPLRNTELIRVR